jgi:hypothetical protein
LPTNTTKELILFARFLGVVVLGQSRISPGNLNEPRTGFTIILSKTIVNMYRDVRKDLPFEEHRVIFGP